MDIRVPLFHKARTGAIHSWRVYVDGATIYSEHGQVDGQKILSSKAATGKNIGRSNETTPEQQAIIEAQAMWTFKRDRKYSLTPEEAKEDVLLPMLAQPFEKRESKLTYPLDVQPKLDGVRALARWEGDKVVLISRSGKPWLVTTHLNEQLERIMPKGTVLDGEIYLHGKGFQWITARTKKRQPGTELLEFHVYDCPESNDDDCPESNDDDCPESNDDDCPESNDDDSLTWEVRRSNLLQLDLKDTIHIQRVNTYQVGTKEDLVVYHNQFVAEGYEGLIARVHSALYEYGHRSSSLLKVKSFEDAEFTITGATHGEGIEQDLVIWRCKNDTNDLEFETRPRGTHAERRALLSEAHVYVGASIKCRFFGRTDLGLPRFPIGIGIRAAEDMS